MIVQPRLEVPAKIAAGIASGTLIRIGGVVRDATSGQIVALLKETPGTESGQAVMKRAAALLRSPGAMATTAAGALAVGVTAYAVVKKRKQAGKREVPECVANLNASLRTYLDAGREGSLDASIIGNLISDLDAVSAYADDGGAAVDFSTELWEALANLVVDHTQRLAEAYSVDVEELPENAPTSPNSTVINLRRHLETQRRIIAGAA
ncbi:hypothetical protein ABZV75_12580 [Streptomyces flaveolus]|uniref:hypothetical protein n=1 Tax=Streptomyces flaveolus TaxID=67297 RepID=UPI0033A6DA8B